ncbi:hypothetical protein NFI96_034118 [Prochilodus magdalenae]|nr:hypothetical protein NFI96_034118 [Prochilodus magdalenae]
MADGCTMHVTTTVLNTTHRHQRLQWCHTRLSGSDSEWHRAIFSDESRFCLGGDAQRIRVWRHHVFSAKINGLWLHVTCLEGLVSLHLCPYRTICRNWTPTTSIVVDPHITLQIPHDFESETSRVCSFLGHQDMPGPDDPLLLTCRAKAAVIHAGGSGIRPLSKNNRLSLTPGLHLPAAPAQDVPAPPKPSSSSSRSSSSALPAADECSESQREAENFPPRRPLKLAPLELPLEVKEAQRQKMRSVQQEARVSVRKLEAVGGEPCEPCPRKVKAGGTDGVAKSPARPPLTTIVNPGKLQQRAGRALLLPVNQLQLGDDDKSAGKGAGRKERCPVPVAKSAPAGQSGHPEQAFGQSACAEQACGQSALPKVQDTGCRRHPRLRRAPRLEEDQSKSGSSTGGLCGDEGKPGLTCPGPSQRSTEKALREASRVLEKASRRNQPGITPTSRVEQPTAGKSSRRMAVHDIQEAGL